MMLWLLGEETELDRQTTFVMAEVLGFKLMLVAFADVVGLLTRIRDIVIRTWKVDVAIWIALRSSGKTSVSAQIILSTESVRIWKLVRQLYRSRLCYLISLLIIGRKCRCWSGPLRRP